MSKQPEMDFDNAMKRFLVRAALCDSSNTPRRRPTSRAAIL
jgi:hypothetical protein